MKQECFSAWIDDHPCAHLVTDAQRRIRWANPAAESVLRRSVEELAGRLLEEILPSIAEGPGASGQAAASGVISCRLVEQGGAEYDVELKALPECFGDTLWVVHRLPAAERRASIDDLSRDDLLSHVSHEVRTPMNSILGYADMLKEAESQNERNQHVDVIRRNAAYILELLNDILGLAKARSGRLQIRNRPFDLHQLFREVAHSFRPQADQKGLQFVQEIAPGVPKRVVGDSTRIREVLTNLLANAIRFTDEGRVTVGAERADGTIRLFVADTGSGIPEEDRATIFEPFAQARTTGEKHRTGTGLGLALTRALVERMGGSIAVESTVARGTRFVIELPLGVEKGPSQEAPNAPPPRKRLLLVEDSDDARRLVELYLRRSDWDVDAVPDASTARQRFRSGDYDAVLMDIRLPDGDGRKCAREIRAWRKSRGLRGIPVVALTGVDSREIECEPDVFAARLLKPLTREELLRGLDEVVRLPAS